MALKFHEEFLGRNFFPYIYDSSQSKNEMDPLDTDIKNGQLYPKGAPYLCPEPVTFIRQFDDIASDSAACNRKFRQMIQGFRKCPNKGNVPVWFNSTRQGINLRLGTALNTKVPTAVQMGDVCVHGLMAGQTGSGKSVLLNNLIFNALTEYAPWELDLYLADFKKVEFSRYMNKKEWVTPHVNACAATSEIRYVVSMIQYLVNCMNAREELFARLGCDKIANFRKQYNVVLPRILLVVDEFQQMFLEASAKEGEEIRRMLTAIVKKGRATGLHILFASQEMSNTLSRSDLANFRLRIALNCTVSVSMDVLGNRAAANISRGTAIVNMDDGTESSNLTYEVPMIETDAKEGMIPYFDDYMNQIFRMAKACNFVKYGKFYKEDEQKPFEDFEKVLKKIESERAKIYRVPKQEFYDILTLGRYVTYANLKYDIQTLFLSKGRNRNILVVSPDAEDLTYLQRLFATNFNTSPRKSVTGVGYTHKVYSFQPVLHNMYPLEIHLKTDHYFTSTDDLAALEEEFADKRFLMQLLQESRAPLDFVVSNYKRNLDELRKRRMTDRANELEQTMLPKITQIFGNPKMDDIPKLCKKIIEDPETNLDATIVRLAENLQKYYTYQKMPDSVFPPTIYWISGIDSVERIPDWMYWMMKNGMDYNILFILMAGSDFDQMTQVAKYCDYLFLSGNDNRIYDRLNVNFTHKAADSIAIDLNIRSNAEERSFKKYKITSDEKVLSPSINFDALLG